MASIPDGWRRVEAGGRFVFSIPPDMQPQAVQGIDSYVGQYRSDGCELGFSYGRYADSLNYEDKPEYTEERSEIGGKEAKVVTFYDPNRGDGRAAVAAVNFPDLGRGRTRLTMHLACRTRSERDTAKRVFQTISFT
jgi:hypothetical protein